MRGMQYMTRSHSFASLGRRGPSRSLSVPIKKRGGAGVAHSPLTTPPQESRSMVLEQDTEAEARRQWRENRRRLQELRIRRTRQRFGCVAVGQVEGIEHRTQLDARAQRELLFGPNVEH